MTNHLSPQQVAVVAKRAATLGSVRAYVDGALAVTVSGRAASAQWRRVVFSKAWSVSGRHTIRIVDAGPAGRPTANLDAFIVLD